MVRMFGLITGNNAGVSRTPWAVWIFPMRERPSRATISNFPWSLSLLGCGSCLTPSIHAVIEPAPEPLLFNCPMGRQRIRRFREQE